MNVYEQIDSIFSGEAEEKPQWASEILRELGEIKILLQNQKEIPTVNIKEENFLSIAEDFYTIQKI